MKIKSATEIASFARPHIFANIREPKITLDSELLKVYRQRLDASNAKFSCAAYAMLSLFDVVDKIERSESVDLNFELDSRDRLLITYHYESYLVFQRATLDMAIAAYWIYFAEKPNNVDGLHGFLKRLKKGLPWLPARSKDYWESIQNAHDSSNFYSGPTN